MYWEKLIFPPPVHLLHSHTSTRLIALLTPDMGVFPPPGGKIGLTPTYCPTI